MTDVGYTAGYTIENKCAVAILVSINGGPPILLQPGMKLEPKK
jgi:hypothetical protein